MFFMMIILLCPTLTPSPGWNKIAQGDLLTLTAESPPPKTVFRNGEQG
jgi:hypothetical protein